MMYPDPMVVAKAKTGTYIGQKDENGVVTYRGIRYAQFAGRWKRLKDLPVSDQVVEAFDTGFACPQVNFLNWYEAYRDYPRDEADCFRMSISTTGIGTNKPVFVFIHGGGNITGGIFDSDFDTKNFVARNPDAVFAVFNYRLGILGTLHLSDYTDDPEYQYSGNLSLLDQVQALKWIHENIAAFGGDPDNVTVAGQSAGSASLFRHIVNPESRAYWKRVICESGTTFFGRPLTLQRARESAAKTMAQLGVHTLEELLALPVSDLLKVPPMEIPLEHVADGLVLPLEPNAALCEGAPSVCPEGKEIMIGCTEGDMDEYAQDKDDFQKTLNEGVRSVCETLNTMTDAELNYFAAEYLPGAELNAAKEFLHNFSPAQGHALAQKYIARDPDREPFIAVSDMLNDYAMTMHLTLVANGLCKNNRVFNYIWKWFPKQYFPLRAIHCTDVPFVTCNPHKSWYMAEVDEAEKSAVYDLVQSLWGGFIRNGQPKYDEYVAAPYDPVLREAMIVNLPPKGEKNPRQADFALLAEVFAEQPK